MRALSFVGAGLLAGAFSGALGVGGALLATPLVRFLGLAPYLAIGTTVPVMLPTTITGAWTYHREGLVDLRAAAWTAPSAAAAAVLGAFTTRRVDGHLLMILTAGIMLVLALRNPARRREAEPPAGRRPAPGLVALGGVAGFFSGLLGIGGGFLLVPAYLRVFRFPVKTALGTSLTVIALTVAPNIAAQAFVGNVDWRVAVLLSLGVIPGARAGALLSIRAPERALRLAIPGALAVVALVYASIEVAALSSP